MRINKTQSILTREYSVCVFLFIASALFSHLDIFDIAQTSTNPNYFLALMVLVCSYHIINISLIKLFIIGIIVDVFAGQLLGEHGFIFLFIFFIEHLYKKYVHVLNYDQNHFLYFSLILIGLVAQAVISLNYEIKDITALKFLLELIYTCFIFYIYRFIFNRFNLQ